MHYIASAPLYVRHVFTRTAVAVCYAYGAVPHWPRLFPTLHGLSALQYFASAPLYGRCVFTRTAVQCVCVKARAGSPASFESQDSIYAGLQNSLT